ncbi:PQQ-dependent sugar dehydrogenase [Engelhardtia mirabilis]|uniref:PQQ-dependent sugar dehydrogenase n=1 Tax=Engelhardtia mirabilis TaxID=2528011 RepID=UPI003AF405BD
MPAAAGPAHEGEGGFPPSFEGVDIPGNLVYPVDLTFAPNGDMYVAEKLGRVYAYRNDVLQTKAVLDIRDIVNNDGDRGLLGIALSPGFVPDLGDTSWLYVLYTESPVPGQDLAYNENDQYSHGVLARYRVDDSSGKLVAVLASRETLLGERLPDGSAPDAFASLHNSHAQGTLVFAPDGSLLVSHGEGAHHNFKDPGGVNAPGFDDWIHPVTGLRGQIPREQDSGSFRSQDLRSLSGKVLRIDPDTGAGLPSNPFFDGDPTSNASRVWALGLRNPFRMALVPGTGSTDPSAGDPGTLLVGDVGAGLFEEIEWLDTPGLNFGWPCREGNEPNSGYEIFTAPDPNPFGWPVCSTPQQGIPTDPMIGYHHFDNWKSFPPGVYKDENGNQLPGLLGGCIIGGAVYPGGSYPAEYDGLFFFGDYSGDWIKTLRFDTAGNPIEVRDFSVANDRMVDIEAHPVTGDLYLVQMGANWASGHVVHLRYGQNLSPTAVLTVDAPSGPSPHTVQFDASASTDPEGQPLAYTWTFDDGSATVQTSVPTIAHTYTQSGVFHPVVRVDDDQGLFDLATVAIAVDSLAPTVSIASPATGTAIDSTLTSLTLSGFGNDSLGGPVDLGWQVDLHHNVHVHPAIYADSTPNATASTTVLPLDPHGNGSEIILYEVLLTASKSDGSSSTDRAWYYPADQLLDPIGTGQLVSRLGELSPPVSLGLGNPDLEVIRDGQLPDVGTHVGDWIDTFHNGDQGDDDWIGMVIPARPEPYARFVSLTFTEGPNFTNGGWFEDVDVEILSGGTWTPVEDLVVAPPYPVGDQGLDFETFQFSFTPRYGEGIRLRGKPGGVDGFITCSELRVGFLTTAAYDTERRDLSDLGELLLKVDFLNPSGSLGLGNPDRELLRNGTMPQVGSASEWAQYATFHGGDQGSEDWLGYRFEDPQTLQSILFQEGLHFSNGGWFETLRAEGRLTKDDPWQPLAGLSIDPSFRSGFQGGQSYETFNLMFAPTIVRDVRILGIPGGADKFVTAAELRAFGPWFDQAVCGWSAYGDLSNPHLHMSLETQTPPLPGYPILIEVADDEQPEAAPGAMLIAAQSASINLGSALLLIDPSLANLSPLSFDALGQASWFATIPDDLALVGVSLYLQCGRFAPTYPGGVRFSTALEMGVCQ